MTYNQIIDWLQDNTDIASRLDDYSNEATKINPEGDYAQIERWIIAQCDISESELRQEIA